MFIILFRQFLCIFSVFFYSLILCGVMIFNSVFVVFFLFVKVYFSKDSSSFTIYFKYKGSLLIYFNRASILVQFIIKLLDIIKMKSKKWIHRFFNGGLKWYFSYIFVKNQSNTYALFFIDQLQGHLHFNSIRSKNLLIINLKSFIIIIIFFKRKNEYFKLKRIWFLILDERIILIGRIDCHKIHVF